MQSKATDTQRTDTHPKYFRPDTQSKAPKASAEEALPPCKSAWEGADSASRPIFEALVSSSRCIPAPQQGNPLCLLPAALPTAQAAREYYRCKGKGSSRRHRQGVDGAERGHIVMIASPQACMIEKTECVVFHAYKHHEFFMG